MRVPWVNILLLVLLLIQAITGYFGLTEGREPAAWILWTHGIVAYAVLVLMFLKAGIILDAWRRKRRWTGRRVGFAVSLGLLLVVLVTGLLWTLNGPIYVGGFSLVSIHIYVAVPLIILMIWHAWHMRFVRRLPEARGRRLFLGAGAGVLAGALLWLSAGRAKAWAGLSGATRRFTGSYEVGSFTGQFPEVIWLADRPPVVDIAEWQLAITGEVTMPLQFGYDDLLAAATSELECILDCTGGWYSAQLWRGVRLGDLLSEAAMSPKARSVTIQSVTGYKRRFDLVEAENFLLALGILVGDDDDFRPLSRGHGYPVRLVAPGERGVEWVKWVAEVRVNDTSPLRQAPLPLQ